MIRCLSRWIFPGLLAALVASLTAAVGPSAAGGAPALSSLVGTFSLDSGHCQGTAAPTGSYLQIEVGGVPVPNVGSSCSAGGWAYTPLTQGSTGLVTGGYQLNPVPTFSSSGDSLASNIIRPVRFLADSLGLASTCANEAVAPTATGACPLGATGFAVPSLDEVAPGTGECAAATKGDCLYGDLSSLGLTWAGFAHPPGLSAVLRNPLKAVSSVQPTCATASGCYAVGVADTPGASAGACVTASTAGSCDLFGTIDPQTGVYALALSTGIALSLWPSAVLHLVLRGTFRPGALPDTTSGAGSLGVGAAGASGGATGGATGGTTTTTTPQGSGEPGSAGDGESSSSTPGSPGGVQQLVGTLSLSPASCQGSSPQGSFVTIAFGSTSEANSSSSCDNGIDTLLQPGTSGLGFGSFTLDPSPTFDANGNSLSDAVVTPTLFKGHSFGLGTSPDDVQDAPSGPTTFAAPLAVVQGTNLAVDLRSLNLTYDGPPNSTCVQSSGLGCWLEGSRVATGTFDPSTGDVVLDWYSSQDFTGGSGEVDFHLAGHFSGTQSPADPSVLSQLAGTDYVVTSSSVDSESFPASVPSTPTGAPGTTSTLPTSPTSVPVLAAPPRVVRIQESASSGPTRRTQPNHLPLLIVGLGLVVTSALLLAGRRSRRDQSVPREELT